MNTCIHADLF
jgi:hypothetical protein